MQPLLKKSKNIQDLASHKNCIYVIYKCWRKGTISGSTIDCIEYFLYLYSLTPRVRFMLIDGTEDHKQMVIDLANQRLRTEDLPKGWENNIVCINLYDLPLCQTPAILTIDWSTVGAIKGFLSKTYWVNIVEIDSHKVSPRKGINYAEMPFIRNSFPYKMKLMLNYYRTASPNKEVTYVNCPALRYKGVDISEIMSILDSHVSPEEKLIFRLNPKEYAYNQFSKHIYVGTPLYIDTDPRCFIECEMQGIPSVYIHSQEDGAYYRYKELSSFNPKDRFFCEDDEVITTLLERL